MSTITVYKSFISKKHWIFGRFSSGVLLLLLPYKLKQINNPTQPITTLAVPNPPKGITIGL